MALIVKKTDSNIEPVQAGLHHARCIRVIDLGHQFNKFNGKKQHKIMLIWELCKKNNPLDPNEKEKVRTDGKPFIVAKRYTASLNEKSNFFADLSGWIGGKYNDIQELNVVDLLGELCAVNVVQNVGKDGKVYSEVKSVTQPMISNLPQSESEPKAFDLSAPDWDLFAEFSDWTRDTIRKSPEYAALDLPENAPPPLKAEPQKQKMPLSEQIIGLLSDSLKAGAITLQFIAENYEMTEEQRLHFESLTA